jgi:hypothetical protein
MTEPLRNPDGRDGPSVADLDPTGGTPRWVKVFGLIALVLVVLFVVLLLTGGHGPSRHSVDGGGDPRPSLAPGLPVR